MHIRGGCPCGSNGKESTCNARHLDSIAGSGRSPEEGNGMKFLSLMFVLEAQKQGKNEFPAQKVA